MGMVKTYSILRSVCVGMWIVSNIALGGAPTDSLTLDISGEMDRHVMLAAGAKTDQDSGQEKQSEVSMQIKGEEKDETQGGERLYNGIVLPEQWPPDYGGWTREPMPVPYLENPPEVINIDVGRQLFVDDFLIEETTLQRTFHQPTYYEGNPIIKPDKEWEHHGPAPFAGPFSGGVWYDPRDELFKMWYTGGYIKYSCYTTSNDGIHWEKTEQDVVPGTNIVIDHGEELPPIPPEFPEKKHIRPIDTTSVWIDYQGDDPISRYKIFYTTWHIGLPERLGEDSAVAYRTSADGIHWSEPIASSGVVGDHTNAHYNPFRDKWVINIRSGRETGRARAYVEGDTPVKAVKSAEVRPDGEIVPWLGADLLDPRNPNSDSAEILPQLYHFDTVAYESLMLGYFSIWHGPENDVCHVRHIPKRNEVVLGFSRDGFHYDRPDRRPFFEATEADGAWNWGNVQSASGACLVVGDKLYLYFTGRNLPEKGKLWDGFVNTGLAFLRRDGFASMDSIQDAGTLTTRLIKFSGKHLFVNTDCDQGELRVEVLDEDGKALAPFTLGNCVTVTADKTAHRVEWKDGTDLSSVAGEPVRFRFHLRLGELYSFWVSPDESGASHGYVGAGGPGYTSFVDTVGSTD